MASLPTHRWTAPSGGSCFRLIPGVFLNARRLREPHRPPGYTGNREAHTGEQAGCRFEIDSEVWAWEVSVSDVATPPLPSHPKPSLRSTPSPAQQRRRRAGLTPGLGPSAADTVLPSPLHSSNIPVPGTSDRRIPAPCHQCSLGACVREFGRWEGLLEATTALIKPGAGVGFSQTKRRGSRGGGFPGGETSMCGSEKECGS